jgi:DnaJ-class molecular chaperone
MWTPLLLILGLVLLVWLGDMTTRPFVKCHRCDGTGKRRYRKGVRTCRYCKGHRKILRLSWRIYAHARHGRQTIVRPR